MKKTITSVSLFFLFITLSIAQQNLTLYDMSFVPQRIYTNPAFIPPSRINIGLPVLSSTYINFGNSGFTINDLYKLDGKVVNYNVQGLIDNLKTDNYFTGAVQIDLLSFGFKLKKNYFSFNLTEKADFWLRYPKAFLDFIWNGNGAFLDKEQNFNFGINATHYREWGFGWSRELSDKLTVGTRLKLLSGQENISTVRSDVKFYTDPNDFSYRASSDILINTSYDTSRYSNPGFGTLFKGNTGFGIDLGATYKYNDKLSFAASVTDLGFINWTKGTTNYASKNPGAVFKYSGFGLSALGGDTVKLDKQTKNLTDSLQKTFDVKGDTHDKYKTYLPAQIYLSGSYALNKSNAAGLLLYGQFMDGTLRPGVTLSLTSRVGKALSAVLSYSIYNRSYNNVGFGFSVNAGPVQLFAVSDNVLGMLVYNQYKSADGSSITVPAYAKILNARCGINITMGRKSLDKDGDGVNDKDDECPTVPGLKDLKGCPDKDGDKIADKDDVCPDVAGLAQFAGCPDTDGDGVKDLEDECPNDKGPLYSKGCPDADGDSIKDADDKCPTVPGLRSLSGCPDKDKDGVRDQDDKCPDQPGPVENDGCPQVKLLLLDATGNTIATIVKNKAGEFIYEKLLPDENVLFKLEVDDPSLKELSLIAGGKTHKIVKEGDGNFHYEKLEPEVKTGEPMKETAVTVKLKEEEKKVLNKAFANLEFEVGKDVLKQTSFASLTELAKLIKSKPAWGLRIAGHTDNVGNEKKNLELSQSRAETVKKFMVLSGVPDNKVIVEFYGSAKPIADNKTPEGRKKNRRVEMTVVQNSN